MSRPFGRKSDDVDNNNSGNDFDGTNDPNLSPPTYSVESDAKGNLYSWKYQVCWPKRPKTGKYSLSAELDLRVGVSKEDEPQIIHEYNPKDASVVVVSSSEQTFRQDGDMIIKKYKLAVRNQDQPTEFTIRTFGINRANRDFPLYEMHNFLIYYRLSMDYTQDGINAIPISVPLMFAYKFKDAIVHSQVKCFVAQEGNERLWCAIKLDANGNPTKDRKERYMLAFSSVRSLLEYYCNLSDLSSEYQNKTGPYE